MTRGEKFLTIYNNLEQFLKKKMEAEEHIPFQQLVRFSSDKYKELYFFRHDLIEYGQLRNAIVHTRDGNKLIAEPLEETVENFEKIYLKITKPKTVMEIIKNKVFVFRPEDRLEDVLRFMGEKNFTTIPVYDGKIFRGVINSSRLTHWIIESAKNNEELNYKSVKLEKLLDFKEDINIIKFVARNTNVYEIRDIYKKNIPTMNRIEAIIITENGSTNESPLGIITDWDIPKIFENL